MAENFAVKANQIGKRKPIAKDVIITGTGKFYFSCDPLMRANLQLMKNGSTAKVSATISETDPVDSAPFVSLEPGSGPANTTDFLGGDSGGFSGFEIDVTALVGNLTLVINNYVLDETP